MITAVFDHITAVLCRAVECFIPTAQTRLQFRCDPPRSISLSRAQSCPTVRRYAQIRREPLPPSLCSAEPVPSLCSLSSIKPPTHFRPGPMAETNLSLSISIFHSHQSQ
ncbi:hypothetical protein M0R45_019517 [Rubus argutus]|uniref:Uncharacterized protein n=1 Tax=Rubus argutus TaxID=59490 RepID=A0AAW1X7I8_RUBAR